jgi:hypothetical protein
MRALLSVPGDVLNRHWDGSIVPRDLAAELIGDKTVAETLDALNSQLTACGIETSIVLRPEIFGSSKALAYATNIVPDLCGHIFIGPPHRLKYLKGVPNLACLTPICSKVEADQICHEFARNPRRLMNVRGIVNGFAAARLLGDPKIIDSPLLLPRKAISSGASLRPRGCPEIKDLLVAPLFLNNHDANNSAHVMISRITPLSQYLASRSGIFQRAPVFMTALALHRDLPSSIAPAVRDLTYLALAGMEFTLIVLIEGTSSLPLEILERFARRLNTSLRIAGFHPSLIDSDAIIVTPASRQIHGLLGVSDYVLLFDLDWPESEINQIAILSGIRPVLLATSHPCLRNSFHKTALVIQCETNHNRQRATVYAGERFDYPSTGSLRNLLATSVRLLPRSRAVNVKHARSVFNHASVQLKAALGRAENHEIHFG